MGIFTHPLIPHKQKSCPHFSPSQDLRNYSPSPVVSPPWQQRQWQSSPRCNPSHLWISSPGRPADRSELQSRQETSQGLSLTPKIQCNFEFFELPAGFRGPHLVVGQPSSWENGDFLAPGDAVHAVYGWNASLDHFLGVDATLGVDWLPCGVFFWREKTQCYSLDVLGVLSNTSW